MSSNNEYSNIDLKSKTKVEIYLKLYPAFAGVYLSDVSICHTNPTRSTKIMTMQYFAV